ncbi:MAG: hypothetical protein H7Z40_00460 [Phycisphaerae bacterium]|nr:hypothetical protein [Gemmatimonadaceae bacterium]
MADTHGFDVIIEANEKLIRKALRGAWKSAECPVDPGDEGRIPEYIDVPVPTIIGGYVIEDGHVQIPLEELDAALAPEVNGAELIFGLNVQLHVQNPPVPSAALLNMHVLARARVPIGLIPGTQDVGVLLDGLPPGNVSATLTSGHPLTPSLDTLLAEFVHKAYENGGLTPPVNPFIPHVQIDNDVVFKVGFITVATMDIHAELFDDPVNPPYRIVVSRPTPTTIRISIPLYLRMFAISSLINLEDPMGIETRLNIEAPFESPPGLYRARLSTPTVTVDAIAPASATVAGSALEGSNYTTNKTKVAGLPTSPNLDTLLTTELITRGTALAQAIGDFEIAVPSEAQIEAAIAGTFHAELESRNFISLWTPSATDDEFEVRDVGVEVISDALIIALNSGDGADLGAITSFIPPDREFAIALNGAVVQAQLDEAIQENGFNDLPKRFREDDKDVDLTELNVTLANGAIRMTGEVTVIDAILGSIDVDARFTVNVGLHWVPNAALSSAGFQELEHHIIGEPDVDPEESVLFWVIAIILAIISLGTGSILIAIIIIVVALIVTAIAESIGSAMLVNGVTGAIEGIQAWPPDLARIGRVEAVFHDNLTPDPDGVVIAEDGLVLEGTMNVLSTCEATEVLAAYSGGTYSVNAATAVLLKAGNISPAALYGWRAGDGSAPVGSQNKLHTYPNSGVYIAKHDLTINQPGGASSRHFAMVNVRNVAPVVDAGPDIIVDEGEVVTLEGHFTDVEPGDTHESIWNFGDSQPPKAGTIVESVTPKGVQGTSMVQHAWCDNGEYVVALRVRDQNGGVMTSTRRVTVRNVPPKVDAGADLFAYPCTVLTLTGRFEDPGWCDTHIGTWEFGDCTPVHPAIVTETNSPPASRGTVVASHVFKRCGTYHATCTVTDDDGGVGRDHTVIRVVDIVNAGFEDGFRPFPTGFVCNAWTPYDTGFSVVSAAAGAGKAVYTCEQCGVHSGQRAQGIAATGRAGVLQVVGANPDWAYQITAWAHVESGGYARLGVDPAGGVDPDADTIVWSETPEHEDWVQLVQRVVATANAITIFLECDATNSGQTKVRFDDTLLVAIQPFCNDPPSDEPPAERCTALTEFGKVDQLPPVLDLDGFTFRSLGASPLQLVNLGQPPGKRILWLGDKGIMVELPFLSVRVTIEVYTAARSPVYALAIGAGGDPLETASTSGQGLEALTLAAQGMRRVQIGSKGREAGLVRICATPARQDLGDELRAGTRRMSVASISRDATSAHAARHLHS